MLKHGLSFTPPHLFGCLLATVSSAVTKFPLGPLVEIFLMGKARKVGGRGAKHLCPCGCVAMVALIAEKDNKPKEISCCHSTSAR